MRLKGRTAIVTGGAGGLGAATARRFAAEGAYVVVTDVADAEPLAAEIDGRFMRHDVSNEAGWDAVVAAARERSGRLDVLVNAAGIEGNLASIEATSLAEWRRVMSINLDGTFLGCRAAVPAMLEAGAGSIVNISSIVSYMASDSALAYGASKAAVEQLTRSIASIGARGGKRVRCNSVHPGVIRTRMTDDLIEAFAKARGVSSEESEAAICAAVPFAARGEPDDVANLILYLASDEAAYVTGSAFKIDGGWSMVSTG